MPYRLMNQLKLKEKTMDEQLKEIAALKSSLSVAQRCVMRSSQCNSEQGFAVCFLMGH